MGLFSKRSNSDSDSDRDSDDGEDWTTECRNCGGVATNWNFCSQSCSSEHWNKEQRASSGRTYNTDPDCPACSGAGSCKLCEDGGW